ncbi:hypothetical protein F320042A7_31090 [Blautia producta]
MAEVSAKAGVDGLLCGGNVLNISTKNKRKRYVMQKGDNL